MTLPRMAPAPECAPSQSSGPAAPTPRSAPAPEEAQSVRYLHPQRREILYLDKPLSLDDVQHEIYWAAPPLVLIGGAGSGKTALTLEKLKEVDGDVLYVTHSAYLAQNARDLYYAHVWSPCACCPAAR